MSGGHRAASMVGGRPALISGAASGAASRRSSLPCSTGWSVQAVRQLNTISSWRERRVEVHQQVQVGVEGKGRDGADLAPVSSRARSCEASDAFLPPAARAMASRSACWSARGNTASTFLRTLRRDLHPADQRLGAWLTSVPRMAANFHAAIGPPPVFDQPMSEPALGEQGLQAFKDFHGGGNRTR